MMSIKISARVFLAIGLLAFATTAHSVGQKIAISCGSATPPSGFVGPDPTGVCYMFWDEAGQSLSGSHRSTIEHNGVITDDQTWGNAQNILDQWEFVEHLWVIQTVCPAAPATSATLKQTGWGKGWKPISIWPLNWGVTQDLTISFTGTYNSNC